MPLAKNIAPLHGDAEHKNCDCSASPQEVLFTSQTRHFPVDLPCNRSGCKTADTRLVSQSEFDLFSLIIFGKSRWCNRRVTQTPTHEYGCS